MASFERFTDIGAWQDARMLAKEIYRVTKRPPFSRDFELRGQIRSASISVMSNIAEGFDRNGSQDRRINGLSQTFWTQRS
jgi:four helix bundle protein